MAKDGKKNLLTRTMDAVATGSSGLMQRMSMSNLVGLQFGGQRDLYKIFGYNRAPGYKEAWQRYRRQDIVSRIIDAPVNALWSNPPVVSSTDAEWNKAWNDLVINRGLWSAIARADKMCGLGNYSLLVIGLDGAGKLSDAAVAAPGRACIYLQPYDYGCSQVLKLEGTPTNERFMKPLLYRVTPTMQQQPKAAAMPVIQAFDVHYTRVLHLAENILGDEIFGNPRIERVWNLLDDLLKVCGGTAETFWLTANKGLQLDVDKDMDLNEDDEAALTEEIEEYINQLRRVIRTRGVTVKDLGSDVPDPKNIFDMIMCLMAGATGIPKRILLGSEAGQLASGEDRNNWAERIEERRADFGEPVVIWPLIRLLTNAGVLPMPTGGTITITWPSAFKLTPLEQNMASAQAARSSINLAKAIELNKNLLSIEEARQMMNLDQPITEVIDTTLTQDGTVTN